MNEKFGEQVEYKSRRFFGYRQILEAARISLDNKCDCNNCFNCACLDFINETKPVFNSIGEVATANRRAGEHWFDPENCLFFNSFFVGGLIENRFFISSERGNLPTDKRGYTIRFVCPNGVVASLYEINHFSTEKDAQEVLNRLKKGLN